jgi:hypothetical protein
MKFEKQIEASLVETVQDLLKEDKTLEIARKKLKYNKASNQLVGYLTPTEIHALVKIGHEPADSYKLPIANGATPKPTWFCFKAKKGQMYKESVVVEDLKHTKDQHEYDAG